MSLRATPSLPTASESVGSALEASVQEAKRLLSYAVVLGPLQEELTAEIQRIVNPDDATDVPSRKLPKGFVEAKVLERFPETDFSDFPLTPMLPSLRNFLFPDGIAITKEKPKQGKDAVSPYYTWFCLTTGAGMRLYAACMIFDEKLKVGRQSWYSQKALCLFSPLPYFDTFRRMLREIITTARTECASGLDRPIWAPRLLAQAFYEIPVPSDLSTQVLFFLGEKRSGSLLHPTFCRDFSFRPLFASLNLSSIAKLLMVILHERHILLHTQTLSSAYVSLVFLIIEALLFPFIWPHTYVPLLPKNMRDNMLQCPAPFLFGVVGDLPRESIPEYVTVFDLDGSNNIIGYPNDLPKIPPSFEQALSVFKGCYEDAQRGHQHHWRRFHLEALGPKNRLARRGQSTGPIFGRSRGRTGSDGGYEPSADGRNEGSKSSTSTAGAAAVKSSDTGASGPFGEATTHNSAETSMATVSGAAVPTASTGGADFDAAALPMPSIQPTPPPTAGTASDGSPVQFTRPRFQHRRNSSTASCASQTSIGTELDEDEEGGSVEKLSLFRAVSGLSNFNTAVNSSELQQPEWRPEVESLFRKKAAAIFLQIFATLLQGYSAYVKTDEGGRRTIDVAAMVAKVKKTSKEAARSKMLDKFLSTNMFEGFVSLPEHHPRVQFFNQVLEIYEVVGPKNLEPLRRSFHEYVVRRYQPTHTIIAPARGLPRTALNCLPRRRRLASRYESIPTMALTATSRVEQGVRQEAALHPDDSGIPIPIGAATCPSSRSKRDWQLPDRAVRHFFFCMGSAMSAVRQAQQPTRPQRSAATATTGSSGNSPTNTTNAASATTSATTAAAAAANASSSRAAAASAGGGMVPTPTMANAMSLAPSPSMLPGNSAGSMITNYNSQNQRNSNSNSNDNHNDNDNNNNNNSEDSNDAGKGEADAVAELAPWGLLPKLMLKLATPLQETPSIDLTVENRDPETKGKAGQELTKGVPFDIFVQSKLPSHQLYMNTSLVDSIGGNGLEIRTSCLVGNSQGAYATCQKCLEDTSIWDLVEASLNGNGDEEGHAYIKCPKDDCGEPVHLIFSRVPKNPSLADDTIDGPKLLTVSNCLSQISRNRLDRLSSTTALFEKNVDVAMTILLFFGLRFELFRCAPDGVPDFLGMATFEGACKAYSETLRRSRKGGGQLLLPPDALQGGGGLDSPFSMVPITPMSVGSVALTAKDFEESPSQAVSEDFRAPATPEAMVSPCNTMLPSRSLEATLGSALGDLGGDVEVAGRQTVNSLDLRTLSSAGDMRLQVLSPKSRVMNTLSLSMTGNSGGFGTADMTIQNSFVENPHEATIRSSLLSTTAPTPTAAPAPPPTGVRVLHLKIAEERRSAPLKGLPWDKTSLTKGLSSSPRRSLIPEHILYFKLGQDASSPYAQPGSPQRGPSKPSPHRYPSEASKGRAAMVTALQGLRRAPSNLKGRRSASAGPSTGSSRHRQQSRLDHSPRSDAYQSQQQERFLTRRKSEDPLLSQVHRYHQHQQQQQQHQHQHQQQQQQKQQQEEEQPFVRRRTSSEGPSRYFDVQQRQRQGFRQDSGQEQHQHQHQQQQQQLLLQRQLPQQIQQQQYQQHPHHQQYQKQQQKLFEHRPSPSHSSSAGRGLGYPPSCKDMSEHTEERRSCRRQLPTTSGDRFILQSPTPARSQHSPPDVLGRRAGRDYYEEEEARVDRHWQPDEQQLHRQGLQQRQQQHHQQQQPQHQQHQYQQHRHPPYDSGPGSQGGEKCTYQDASESYLAQWKTHRRMSGQSELQQKISSSDHHQPQPKRTLSGPRQPPEVFPKQFQKLTVRTEAPAVIGWDDILDEEALLYQELIALDELLGEKALGLPPSPPSNAAATPHNLQHPHQHQHPHHHPPKFLQQQQQQHQHQHPHQHQHSSSPPHHPHHPRQRPRRRVSDPGSYLYKERVEEDHHNDDKKDEDEDEYCDDEERERDFKPKVVVAAAPAKPSSTSLAAAVDAGADREAANRGVGVRALAGVVVDDAVVDVDVGVKVPKWEGFRPAGPIPVVVGDFAIRRGSERCSSRSRRSGGAAAAAAASPSSSSAGGLCNINKKNKRKSNCRSSSCNNSGSHANFSGVDCRTHVQHTTNATTSARGDGDDERDRNRNSNHNNSSNSNNNNSSSSSTARRGVKSESKSRDSAGAAVSQCRQRSLGSNSKRNSNNNNNNNNSNAHHNFHSNNNNNSNNSNNFHSDNNSNNNNNFRSNSNMDNSSMGTSTKVSAMNPIQHQSCRGQSWSAAATARATLKPGGPHVGVSVKPRIASSSRGLPPRSNYSRR